jgi:hypothetical protein
VRLGVEISINGQTLAHFSNRYRAISSDLGRWSLALEAIHSPKLLVVCAVRLRGGPLNIRHEPVLKFKRNQKKETGNKLYLVS